MSNNSLCHQRIKVKCTDCGKAREHLGGSMQPVKFMADSLLAPTDNLKALLINTGHSENFLSQAPFHIHHFVSLSICLIY